MKTIILLAMSFSLAVIGVGLLEHALATKKPLWLALGVMLMIWMDEIVQQISY